MLRKILLLLIILSGLHVSAQNTIMNKNIIYGESTLKWWHSYYGSATGFSNRTTLNYERIFIQGKVNLYGRTAAGIGHSKYTDGQSRTNAQFYLGVGTFFGWKGHHLDLQAGAD